MNPFLDDPIAQPLTVRPKGSWRFPFTSHRHCARMSRQAGAIALAAGLGAGLGVSAHAHAIDINTATQSQLQAVKGVGPRTAQTIVQERTRAGSFESLEDLSDRVRGIGVKKLQAMQAGGVRVGQFKHGSLVGRPTGMAQGILNEVDLQAERLPRPRRGGQSIMHSELNQLATPTVLELAETMEMKAPAK